MRKNNISKSARQAAAAILSYRTYSSNAVFDKLIEKGYSEQESAEAVEWLTELGYLNDAAYAADVIRAQRAKGYGPKRILLYLQTRGISREMAEEALDDAFGDEDSSDSAAKAIDAFLLKHVKCASEAPERAERQKLAMALARRGFDYSDIRAGLERLEE